MALVPGVVRALHLVPATRPHMRWLAVSSRYRHSQPYLRPALASITHACPCIASTHRWTVSACLALVSSAAIGCSVGSAPQSSGSIHAVALSTDVAECVEERGFVRIGTAKYSATDARVWFYPSSIFEIDGLVDAMIGLSEPSLEEGQSYPWGFRILLRAENGEECRWSLRGFKPYSSQYLRRTVHIPDADRRFEPDENGVTSHPWVQPEDCVASGWIRVHEEPIEPFGVVGISWELEFVESTRTWTTEGRLCLEHPWVPPR